MFVLLMAYQPIYSGFQRMQIPMTKKQTITSTNKKKKQTIGMGNLVQWKWNVKNFLYLLLRKIIYYFLKNRYKYYLILLLRFF